MGWSAQSDTPSDLSRRISKISERWVGVHSQTLPVTLVGESARYLRDGLECTVRHSQYLSRRISKISERWVGVHSQTLPVTLIGESARISERWVGVHSQTLPVTLIGESARYLRDGLECTVRHSQ